jgi:hypothetical protein
MTDNEPRAWTLTNTILAAMGALILLLLGAGFWSINSKIESGDLGINARLAELSAQLHTTNDLFQKLREDVTRIDTHQKSRLDRERDERIRVK